MEAEEPKTILLSLILPDDRAEVTVKLIADGKVIYEKTHDTSSATIDISLKGIGTNSVEIYYDDELMTVRELNFE